MKKTVNNKNVYLINDDAHNCTKALDALLGMKRKYVDCIVSTLPCSNINYDDLIKRAVLPILKDKGCFVQYMHTVSMLKGFSLRNSLDTYFDNIISDHVLLNMPPVLVYTCNYTCPD